MPTITYVSGIKVQRRVVHLPSEVDVGTNACQDNQTDCCPQASYYSGGVPGYPAYGQYLANECLGLSPQVHPRSMNFTLSGWVDGPDIEFYCGDSTVFAAAINGLRVVVNALESLDGFNCPVWESITELTGDHQCVYQRPVADNSQYILWSQLYRNQELWPLRDAWVLKLIVITANAQASGGFGLFEKMFVGDLVINPLSPFVLTNVVEAEYESQPPHNTYISAQNTITINPGP